MESYQERLNKRYKEESLQLISYEGYNKPCIIKCLTCGEEYTYKRYSDAIKNSKKYLCHKCGKAIYLKNKFIQSLHDIFPNEPFEIIKFSNTQEELAIKCLKCHKIIKYQHADSIKERSHLCQCYSKVDLREKLRIWNDFVNYINDSPQWELYDKNYMPNSPSRELISCVCTKCGKINKKSIYDYMRGTHCCCSRWGNLEEQLLKEMGDEYIILTKPTHTRQRIDIQHNCGYIYSINPRNFLKGYSRCPQCCKNKSRGERRILEWLKNNKIDYIREYIQLIKGHLLRFDFYLPEYDLYIEYQGKQHFIAVDFFGGEKSFKLTQKYDNLKREFAKDNLIEISYKDYDLIEEILNSVVQRLVERRTPKQEETEEV